MKKTSTSTFCGLSLKATRIRTVLYARYPEIFAKKTHYFSSHYYLMDTAHKARYVDTLLKYICKQQVKQNIRVELSGFIRSIQ